MILLTWHAICTEKNGWALQRWHENCVRLHVPTLTRKHATTPPRLSSTAFQNVMGERSRASVLALQLSIDRYNHVWLTFKLRVN